jgi:methyl-accepting chemotaxis protein
MALEAELRSRVERSLKELEEVVGSLSHVRRLADSQQASAEQLSRVASAMEDAGSQFRALLESVGHSGATLKTAADTLKAADPAPAFEKIGALVAGSRDEVGAVRQAIGVLGTRVDATVQLGEAARGELTTLRAAVGEVPARIEAGARAQASALDRLEKAIAAKVEDAGDRVAAVEKRVGAAIVAAWVAAAVAAVGAVLAVVGLIR